MIKVIVIKVTDRIKEVGLTQEVLSKHSSLITTRFGFHELSPEVCSREAYIILHIRGNSAGAEHLLKDLSGIGGIEVQDMDFSKPAKKPAKDVPGSIRILGLLVEKDHDIVIAVQKVLTTYGCVVRARLGVNEDVFGKPAGLIILELTGDTVQMDLLEKDLASLKKIHLRKILF